MAINQVLSIPRLSDKTLLECFEKVARVVGENEIVAKLRFFGGDYIQFDPLEDNELINKLSQDSSTLIEHLMFSISPNDSDGYILEFSRGGVETTPKSPYYDQIRFKEVDQVRKKLSNPIKLQIAQIVISQLHAFTPGRAIATTPEQIQLQAIHESNLDRLEQLNEKLIETTANYRVELDQQHSAKIDKLEAELEIRKNDLNKEHEHKTTELLALQKSLDDELEQKKQELQRKTEELENQRRELDDKNNTHARRQIRQDILKEIKARQESFKLTDGTNALRKPIMLGIGFLIIVFMVLAVFSVSEFKDVLAGNDFNKIILLSIKQAVYTAGAIGSILYLIKWQNRWFEQHATAEFHLKKLELDIERASWVVETTLEWKDAKGTAIPTELLESLTKNLFNEAKEVSSPLVHPADQLASALLGSSTSIKLKVGDAAELQVDPKKLSKSDAINTDC